MERENSYKNFKHRKFSNFYKTLFGSRSSETSEDDQKSGLLTSLRFQLTNAALNDDNLKARANRVPLYHPRKRIDTASLKQFYQNEVPISEGQACSI